MQDCKADVSEPQVSACQETYLSLQSLQGYGQRHQQPLTAAAGYPASLSRHCSRHLLMPLFYWRQLCHQAQGLPKAHCMVPCIIYMQAAALTQVGFFLTSSSGVQVYDTLHDLHADGSLDTGLHQADVHIQGALRQVVCLMHNICVMPRAAQQTDCACSLESM